MARAHGSVDLAVAGAVLVVPALLAALAPGWAFLAVTLAVVALGLGAASLVLPRRARRAGAVVVLLSVVALALGVARLAPAEPTPAIDPTPAEAPAATDDAVPEAAIPAPATTSPGATVIAYEIATDGMSVTHLSYVDLVDGRPTMLEELGVPPPFRHVVTVPSGSGVDLTDLSVTGMGGASARRTTCAITVDGQTVARSSADGAYGLVTCVVPSS